jgi:hypothetical protein
MLSPQFASVLQLHCLFLRHFLMLILFMPVGVLRNGIVLVDVIRQTIEVSAQEGRVMVSIGLAVVLLSLG